MKKNLVQMLGIAFIVALIATGIFYGLFISKLRNTPETPQYTVVTASKALARGTVLQAADLKLASLNKTSSPKGTFTSTDQLVGFTVLDTISAGQPLTEDRVATHKSVPPGMRAISVHVSDSSGVVSLLRPGYKVDIQVVANRRGGEVGLRTVLQNVEVLTTSAPENQKPVVNLLVTPADAEVVGLADSTARIRLVLRNPQDDSRSLQSAVPVSDVFRSPEEPKKVVPAATRAPLGKISQVIPQR